MLKTKHTLVAESSSIYLEIIGREEYFRKIGAKFFICTYIIVGIVSKGTGAASVGN